MTDLHKLRHNDDPSSSHEAIADHDASGIRQAHMEKVYSCVAAHPDSTAGEMVPWLMLDEYQIRRRLTDLKNAKRIFPGLQRKCKVKGTTMVTWSKERPTGQQELL